MFCWERVGPYRLIILLCIFLSQIAIVVLIATSKEWRDRESLITISLDLAGLLLFCVGCIIIPDYIIKRKRQPQDDAEEEYSICNSSSDLSSKFIAFLWIVCIVQLATLSWEAKKSIDGGSRKRFAYGVLCSSLVFFTIPIIYDEFHKEREGDDAPYIASEIRCIADPTDVSKSLI